MISYIPKKIYNYLFFKVYRRVYAEKHHESCFVFISRTCVLKTTTFSLKYIDFRKIKYIIKY